jgi:hypothetical protein
LKVRNPLIVDSVATGNSSRVLAIVTGNVAKSVSSTPPLLAPGREVAAPTTIVRPQEESRPENLPCVKKSSRRSTRRNACHCCSHPAEDSSETSCSGSSSSTTTASDNILREDTAKRKASEEDLERSRNVRQKTSSDWEQLHEKSDFHVTNNDSILLEAILPVVVVDRLVPHLEAPKQLEADDARPVTELPKEQKADNEVPQVEATKQQEADEIENEPMVVGNVNATASKQLLIEVYLVNSEKFHAIETMNKEVQLDEHFLNSKDSQARETAHRIIQSRVR